MGATHSAQSHSPPLRPFHKHGGRHPRLYLMGGAMRRRHRRPSRGSGRKIGSTSSTSSTRSLHPDDQCLQSDGASTLGQLILLQDWQRVLIRATLFPKEIIKPCRIKLYGIRWNVLPLHLACALQPPSKVVSVLLSVGGTSSAMTPVQGASSSNKKRVPRLVGRRKWQNFQNLTSTKILEDEKGLLSMGRGTGRQGQEDDSLSSYQGDRSTVTKNTPDLMTKKKKRHFDFSPRAKPSSSPFYFHQSTRSLVSLEQSIGDIASAYTMEDDDLDDESTSSTQDGDDEYSSTGDHRHFRDKPGIILQLTSSGEILPMAMMALEPQDTSTTTADEDSTATAAMGLQSETLLQAASETPTLLPIHIACLYQASSSVVQVLLEAYPMGAMSAVLGMLPIHLVASGWKAEPLVLNPASSAVLSSMATMTEAEDPSSPSWTMQSLRLLIQAAPETATARSSSHGLLLPSEYIESNPKDFNKDECVTILDEALLENSFRDRSMTENPFQDVINGTTKKEAPIKPTERKPTEESSTLREPTASVVSNTNGSQPPLFRMITTGNWEGAMTSIQSEPTQAREWYYGMEVPPSCDVMTQPAKVWKRLALHVACVIMSVSSASSPPPPPLEMMELLIRAYPQALELPDPHSGSLPLHLACRHGASLPILRVMLQAKPASTKAIDDRGRLPIHYAILSQAEYPVVELLVRHDPASVFCPDEDGKTPLHLAQHIYPIGSSVLGLLELVWM